MKTKNPFKILPGILAGLALIGLAAAPFEAHADASAQSFNTTNVIKTAVTISGSPTNTTGVGVGSSIAVGDHRTVDITIDCFVYNMTNTGNLVIKLGTTDKLGAPVAGDFESTPRLTLAPSIASLDGGFHLIWRTNDVSVGASSSLGILNITNNTDGAMPCVVSNLNVKLDKKVVPVRFP